jgi:hypothetical protein
MAWRLESPPLESGQIQMEEVCDLPNIVMGHEMLQGLISNPLFSNAVSNWHIL